MGTKYHHDLVDENHSYDPSTVLVA